MPAEQRLVFGSVAAAYDEHRPAYPDTLYDELLSRFEVSPRVLDIGCGTGKVAAALAVRGLAGVGVEPDADMAALAAAHLEDAPWLVLQGDFETVAIDDGSFDLLTCGQAWHWIDPERGMTRARALLRPGGWLALFWNRAEWPDKALRADLDVVYDEHAPEMRSSFAGSREGYKGKVLSIDPAPEGFDTARVDEFHHHVSYTTEGWLALLGTHSDHVLLDEGPRNALHTAVADVIDDHGGVLDLRYRTECWSGRRA